MPDHACSRDLAARAITARYARKVGQNAIQLIHDHTWQHVKAVLRGEFARPDRLPIPCGTLAPREVPGCYFEEPQSAQWREQHRTVSFLQQSV